MAIIIFVPTFLLPQEPRNEMPHRPLAQFYARHVQRPHDNESMPTELWQLVRPAERLSGGLGSWWVQTGGVCGPQGTESLPRPVGTRPRAKRPRAQKNRVARTGASSIFPVCHLAGAVEYFSDAKQRRKLRSKNRLRRAVKHPSDAARRLLVDLPAPGTAAGPWSFLEGSAEGR